LKDYERFKKFFKNLGFMGVGVCAACCLLPIVGVMFGLSALMFLTEFLEWAGIIAMVSAITSFGIYYFSKRKASACDLDCACKKEDGAETRQDKVSHRTVAVCLEQDGSEHS
jgi:hypothetical protein